MVSDGVGPGDRTVRAGEDAGASPPLLIDQSPPTQAVTGLKRRVSRRTKAVSMVLVIVVVIAVASGILVRFLDGRYGPIGGGFTAGPVSERGLVISKDGFSSRMASAPGTTVQMVALLEDTGSHTVKVSSVDADTAVTGVQWSTYRTALEGNVQGVDTAWRAFPATIPAHGFVRLLLTLRRPASCVAYDRLHGDGAYDGSLQVHWRSLIRAHSDNVMVLGDPFTIC